PPSSTLFPYTTLFRSGQWRRPFGIAHVVHVFRWRRLFYEDQHSTLVSQYIRDHDGGRDGRTGPSRSAAASSRGRSAGGSWRGAEIGRAHVGTPVTWPS